MKYEVLLVEDDEAIALLIHTLLTRNGIDVDKAVDGPGAIDCLRTKRYNVIVLDLMIPGISGLDVIQFMKQSGIYTPIAVVSAVSSRALTQLDRSMVKAVIAKPFDVDAFVETIRELCATAT